MEKLSSPMALETKNPSNNSLPSVQREENTKAYLNVANGTH